MGVSKMEALLNSLQYTYNIIVGKDLVEVSLSFLFARGLGVEGEGDDS